MKYLFFDIECANCDNGNGKICSFGYVLTDESFKVIKKEDIIINPRSHFFLKGRNNSFEIVLAYPKEVFRKAPPFPHFYKQIKKMLEDTDTIVFGHAVYNDVNFIKSECRRYNLPCIEFHFNDSQLIYRKHKKIQREVSLADAAADFGLEPEQLHKSDDDAMLTMQLVREMCRYYALTLPELIEKFPLCDGEIKDFCITRNNIVTVAPELKLAGKNYTNYTKYISTVRPRSGSKMLPFFNGKKVSFSKAIEKRQFRVAAYLISLITDAGGRYVQDPLHADIFVKNPDFLCKREVDVDTAIEAGASIEKISYEKLLEELYVTSEDLDSHKDFKIEELLPKKKPNFARKGTKRCPRATNGTKNTKNNAGK